MDRTILNTTKNSSDRFKLLPGAQGCYGDPDYYPTHKFMVVSGTDRGNGYQGYYSTTYVLTECPWFPPQARLALIKKLSWAGYNKYLQEIGVL